jgi:hypothetical protein
LGVWRPDVDDPKIYVILSGAQRQSKDAGVLTDSDPRRIKPNRG